VLVEAVRHRVPHVHGLCVFRQSGNRRKQLRIDDLRAQKVPLIHHFDEVGVPAFEDGAHQIQDERGLGFQSRGLQLAARKPVNVLEPLDLALQIGDIFYADTGQAEHRLIVKVQTIPGMDQITTVAALVDEVVHARLPQAGGKDTAPTRLPARNHSQSVVDPPILGLAIAMMTQP